MQWYCVRTAPRQEGKVAARMRVEDGLEIFSPRIRFRRGRMGRRIWATEALFPGYLFVLFDYPTQHRKIRALPGVSGVVEFGGNPAIVEDEVIAGLRSLIGDDHVLQVTEEPQPNSEVIVVEGPLKGLQLLVTRVMPARQRIAVLLEILGMEREVELSTSSTVPARVRTTALVADLRRS